MSGFQNELLAVSQIEPTEIHVNICKSLSADPSRHQDYEDTQVLGLWFYIPVFIASFCGTFPTCVYIMPMGDSDSQGLLFRKSVSSI